MTGKTTDKPAKTRGKDKTHIHEETNERCQQSGITEGSEHHKDKTDLQSKTGIQVNQRHGGQEQESKFRKQKKKNKEGMADLDYNISAIWT